jgi:hypothetical protein
LIHNRRAIGAEIDPKYVGIAKERINAAETGNLRIRPMDRPVYNPNAPDLTLPPQFVKLGNDVVNQPTLLEKKSTYSAGEEQS